MSWEASTWALKAVVGNPTRKLVLLGYANHASASGEDAWPSVKTVADYAECEARSVQRHVSWLVENGYMREGSQEVPRAKYRQMGWDLRYVPVNYDLSLTEDQRQQWMVAHAAGEGNDLRRRAAEAGAQGGTPAHKAEAAAHLEVVASTAEPEGCQNVTPQSEAQLGLRGDSRDSQGVTAQAVRGDAAVTQTVLEPSSTTTQPLTPSIDADAPTASIAAPGDLFDEFWQTYPRRAGKAAARKAWDRLSRTVGQQVMLDGARRLAADPNLPSKDEARFIPHPSTWLNAAGWDDDPLPPRIGGGGRRGYREDQTARPVVPQQPELSIDDVFGPPAVGEAE